MINIKHTINVILILLAININAEGLYTYGEVSYLPIVNEAGIKDLYNKDILSFCTSIGVGVEYKFLYLETEMNTFMVKDKSYMFQPYTQEYLVRAGIEIKMFTVQYEHLCAHSIDGLGDNYGHGKLSLMFDTRHK